MKAKTEVLEFGLDPIIQLEDIMGNTSIFEGVLGTEKKRKKQKDGIISQSGNYQIIKKLGKYYMRIEYESKSL